MDEGKVALPSEVRSECIALSKEAAQFRKGGEFIEAASTGERVLTLVQAWLGWDDPEVLQTLEWLVSTYRSAEDWNRAEIRCMDLLGWWQRNAGPEHFRSIDARLAVEHIQLLSRLSAAERLQLVEADSAIAIAQKLYSEGNYSAAIPFGEKAASIREKVLGDHDAHYAACLNDLGAFYLAVNDLSKAETFLERSLNIRQRINGDVHPATATTMNNLAELYRTTGNFVRARELRHREVEFAKQLHGELHPSYAISLSNHGSLCKDMGDYSAAESLYAQSLNIKLAAFGCPGSA